MDYDIGEAFNAIENELIDSMMRNFSRHRAEELKEGFNWAQWQAKQLKSLEQYRKANIKKFNGKFTSINNKMAQMIRTAHADGGAAEEAKILTAIKNGFNGISKLLGTDTAEFFKVNERKLNALIEATTNDMQKAETAVLRLANDQYRKIIYNAQVYANTGAGTYEKAVDMATKDFLSAGINCIVYRNGRRVNIKSYAEMALRTANKRAYLQGEGAKRQEWGISTVILNKRSNPCPLCAPFVGKVFIDDVWSGGSKDGISNVTGVKYPLLSEAIHKGLYHPNCRDSHTTYFEGISTPPDGSEYTADELDALAENYKAGQKANQAEHQAERMERLGKYSLDRDNKRAYTARAKQWRAKAGELSEATGSKQQRYKPVELSDEAITGSRIDKQFNIRKVETAVNDIYVSDSVKLKRRALHNLDTSISKAYSLLGEQEAVGKPLIQVISDAEMQSGALASYDPRSNTLSVVEQLLTTDKLTELQKGFACPDDKLSTYLHELIHWQDARKYRAKCGDITDFSKYIEYLNRKFAPKLAKLQEKGYNINSISEYAAKKMQDKRYDEVFTEYRVKYLLE